MTNKKDRLGDLSPCILVGNFVIHHVRNYSIHARDEQQCLQLVIEPFGGATHPLGSELQLADNARAYPSILRKIGEGMVDLVL